jgi:hypothetical protein
MKVRIVCFDCARDSGGPPPDTLEGDILDEGFVHFRCPNGHEKQQVFHEPLFDLMFTLAVFALIDGYYREAVIGFTSALERFFEFFVHVVARRSNVTATEYHVTRGHIRFAERQYGAFCICYLLAVGRHFDFREIDAKKKLRNETAHEGYIPTREEALNYAELAWREIRAALRELYANGKDVDLLISEFASERAAGVEEEKKKNKNKKSGQGGGKKQEMAPDGGPGAEARITTFGLANSFLGLSKGEDALAADAPFDRDLSWWTLIRDHGNIKGERRTPRLTEAPRPEDARQA